MLTAFLVYLGAVNLAAFAMMGADKRRAMQDQRRIPERRLLTYAAIGGALGAVAAQQLFRHKTRKEPFRTVLMGFFFIWTAAILALSIPEIRVLMLRALAGLI